MKKIFAFFTSLLLVIVFTFTTFFLAFKVFENISLIFSPQEIKATINKVEFTHPTRPIRRSHYCIVYFEFELENEKYGGNSEFHWLLIDRISNTIRNEYRTNAEVIIAIDKYGNYQIKKQIKKELIVYSLYCLASILLLVFAVSLFVSNLVFKDKKKHTE